MKKTSSINIRYTKDEKDRVEKLAIKKGLSITKYVEYCINYQEEKNTSNATLHKKMDSLTADFENLSDNMKEILKVIRIKKAEFNNGR